LHNIVVVFPQQPAPRWLFISSHLDAHELIDLNNNYLNLMIKNQIG